MYNETIMQPVSTITVLGAGYVGLTTATLLAHAGYKVYLIEPDQERLKVIKTGKSFFYEKGLDPIIEAGISKGSLIPTDSYKESIPSSDMVFSCVGTPDNPDGSSNLTHVFSAAEQTAQYAKPGLIYIQKSTVPVGTGKEVEKTFNNLKKSIKYVSNPEFLREGIALLDTLFPDRIVIGSSHEDANQKVLDAYKKIELLRPKLLALSGLPTDRSPETSVDLVSRGEQMTTKYVATQTLESAELVKVTANAFLALKISFANSIAMLADHTGGDFREIVEAVGADPRIGSLLCNGRGYGGGCFPKDISGLIASGLENGVDLEIIRATQQVNSAMPGYIVEKLQKAFDNHIAGKKVAVLGLSFTKVGTSDTRKSPGIAIANLLVRAGATVTVFDPEAKQEAHETLEAEAIVSESVEVAIHGADAAVLSTAWPEFINLKATTYEQALKGEKILFDATNSYDKKSVEPTSLKYLAVGG